MAAYVFFNVGLLAALPLNDLATSSLPAADAARLAFGPGGATVVTVFAVVSLVGILNVTVMFSPRIVYGMSRDGYLPPSLTMLNRASTPGIAMGVTLLFASVLAAGLSFETLFGVAAFLGTAMNAVVYLALFRLRFTEPDLERPFRAIGYPWLPGIGVLISLALLIAFVIADPFTSAISLAALILSWPIYRLAAQKEAARHA